MAIFSLNVSSIGKTTHSAGTAAAHIRYISRQDARPVIMADHLPSQSNAAQQWFDQYEEDSRKNARVADKIRIALPVELSREDRRDLVKDYMSDITGDRLPWYAAIHQEGKDAHNPHVHIIVHDRDFETGARILRLSDSRRDRVKAGLSKNGVEELRERWETVCNAALKKKAPRSG